MGAGGDWYSWGSPPTGLPHCSPFLAPSSNPEYSGRPASQWGPGYSTEEDALARGRMQHSQEELRAAGGVRGHQEVDLGAGGRGQQEQEHELGGVTARDLSQRPTVTTQAERLGINSNIYSLYQGHLAGQAARQAGQFSTDDLSGQLQVQGRPRQDGLHSSSQGENRQQIRESPRAMEPDSSTEDPPSSKKDAGGASVEEEKLEVYNKEEKMLPNYEKAEELASQGGEMRVEAGFSKKEERTPEYNKEDRMPSFTFNKNEKILNFNKDVERGYSKGVDRMVASSSNIVPPALKKKRFSNSLLEQFGDLVKEEEHVGEFPLSVEINELESSSPESVSPPRARPFPLSPNSPLSPRKRGRKPKHYSEILFELGQRGISITKTRPGEPDPRISHKVS